MKRLFVLVSSVLFLACTAAQGQFSVTITVDENGNGHFSNSSNFNQTLTSGKMADPGPGGSASALTYSLINPPGLTAGDLILTDPTTLAISDIIRFNPNETAPDASTGALVFYSSDTDGDLADGPLPTALYTNDFILPEGTGTVDYTPTSGEPGFVTGAGGPVTYVITSTPAVPEPSSLALLGTGLLTVIGAARRRLRA